MIRMFLLFIVACNPQGKDCQMKNGGYYITQEKCEDAKRVARWIYDGAQCKATWTDPD